MDKRHFAMGAVIVAGLVGFAVAETNVQESNKFAWGENVGWLNWRDANGGMQGVRFLSDHLDGYIWGENIGWINTGNGGGPYANMDNTDFGVNINPDDTLSGFAWGENVGWINFDGGAMASPPQAARIDRGAGRLRGYAWGENIGWINLDDPVHFVGIEAGSLCSADFDGDFDVDLTDFGTFGAAFNSMIGDANYNPAADFDGDGDVDLTDFGTFGSQFNRTVADCTP